MDEDASEERMLRDGKYEEVEDMGPNLHRSKEEEECTSSLEEGTWPAVVLQVHSEVASNLPPPSNEEDGRRYPATNLGQRKMRRDERATHWGHSQICSSLH